MFSEFGVRSIYSKLASVITRTVLSLFQYSSRIIRITFAVIQLIYASIHMHKYPQEFLKVCSLKFSLLKYGYICKHYLPIVTSFSALLDSVTSICHRASPARHIIHMSIIVIEMWHVSRTPVFSAPRLHTVTQVTNP